MAVRFMNALAVAWVALTLLALLTDLTNADQNDTNLEVHDHLHNIEGRRVLDPISNFSSPSSSPSESPSETPSWNPSQAPSKTPSRNPSQAPSKTPSRNPSQVPSRTPSRNPSQAPSRTPSRNPSQAPSRTPSRNPSQAPSRTPSQVPSHLPSKNPGRAPSTTPTRSPSGTPSRTPSRLPSLTPSRSPSRAPSKTPSRSPSRAPSRIPTKSPSRVPSLAPSRSPSRNPSRTPSKMPLTSTPSFSPSGAPSLVPSTSKPSRSPSGIPTTSKPSASPSSRPSHAPSTSMPSTTPSKAPVTSSPSRSPSIAPSTSSPTTSPTPYPAQNILMIIVDDLKASVRSFGDNNAITPNMDRLGAMGIRFTNQHVSISECAPSRVAMFTGRRPDQSLVFGRQPVFRVKNRNVWTWPAWLRGVGYSSVSVGKTFDISSFTKITNYNLILEQCSANEPPGSSSCTWDEEVPAGLSGQDQTRCPGGALQFPPISSNQNGGPMSYGDKIGLNSSLNDQFLDSCLAAQAVARLKEYAANKRPFVLAVGFLRPHLPWAAPQKYWNMFPANQAQGFANSIWSKDVPNAGFFYKQSSTASFRRSWDELGTYRSILKKNQRPRAYYAMVAYVDDMIGKVVDAVVNSSSQWLRDNTAIILWGDNGLHLGNTLYGKKTLFEQTTRTPLIVVPSMAWQRVQSQLVTGIGKTIQFPVESIDIFPTAIELAGAIMPANIGLAGKSLIPYFFDQTTPRKLAAVMQYRDQRRQFSSIRMGYALRSTNYRLIMYFNWSPSCWGSTMKCPFSNTLARKQKSELYYYPTPGSRETVNVFKDPRHTAAKNELLILMSTKAPDWPAL